MLQPRIYARAILTLSHLSSGRRLASSKAIAAANLRFRKHRETPSASAASAAAASPAETAAAEVVNRSETPSSAQHGGVYEREMYFFDTSTLPDVRLLLSAGAAIFALMINYADIIRRDPPAPVTQEEADTAQDIPIAPQPAWRRYTLAVFLVSSGVFVLGWSIWWPSRNIAQLTLISPAPTIQLPRSRFIHQGKILTPYHACSVRLVSQGSVFSKRLFPARIIPFDRLRLLGPLSNEQKAWHPINSAAFKKRKGRFPVTVPIAVAGERASYTLRRIAGKFTDPEGLERALLENDRAGRPG